MGFFVSIFFPWVRWTGDVHSLFLWAHHEQTMNCGFLFWFPNLFLLLYIIVANLYLILVVCLYTL